LAHLDGFGAECLQTPVIAPAPAYFCLVGWAFGAPRMKNDWRSWRTEGDWLTEGQKRDLDDIGAAIIIAFFVAIYVWVH
jgi:hypothetical protein